MVQIVGKYKHVSNAPNFESYMKALGVPATIIPNILSQKPTITFSENNGHWTVHHSDAGTEWSTTFKLGEPYNEKTFDGDSLQSVTKREGDKLITESMVRGTKDNRVYEFNDAGFTLHMSSPKFGETISSIYKRA